MTTKEYSAYIKGLMEGLNLDESKPENKVIKALCGIIEQMAGEIETLEKNTETLHDYIEEIDEDLGSLEEYVLGDECDCDCCDDDDDDDDDCDCDCCCGENDFRMLMCPHCNEEIYFDDTIEPDELICPACGKPVADKAED